MKHDGGSLFPPVAATWRWWARWSPARALRSCLAAFERSPLAADDRVLLVGRATPPIRELLQTRYDQLIRQQRIVVVDRYVSDEELGAAFFAADVVAVTHPRQIGSSGTLVRAGRRRAILAHQ